LYGRYVAGNADSTGEDLVHNANDEIVAVLIQYRLGLFGMLSLPIRLPQEGPEFLSGFLPGSEVKNNGDLNAGIREYPSLSSANLVNRPFQSINNLRWNGFRSMYAWFHTFTIWL
jgi:hypothetical protein